MKKSLLLCIFLLAICCFSLFTQTPSAHAFFAKAGTEVNSTQTINSNAYFGGQTLFITGTIHGDLFCGGQNIDVNATVDGDVICAGQNVTIHGIVDGNIRAAGQQIVIDAQVNRNVSVFAQTLTIDSSSQIQGDVSFAAQQVDVNGTIDKELYGASQNTTINGKIGSNVSLDTQSLTIGSKAIITGNLSYQSPQHAVINKTSIITGTTTYTYVAPKQNQSQIFQDNAQNILSGIIGAVIYWILALALSALILLPLCKNIYIQSAQETNIHPLETILIGFVMLVLFPIAMLIFLLTFIGIPFAIFLLFAYIVMIFIGNLFGIYTLGDFLIKTVTKQNASSAVLIIIVGVVVYAILFAIPFIGWIVTFLLMLAGIGSIYSLIRKKTV